VNTIERTIRGEQRRDSGGRDGAQLGVGPRGAQRMEQRAREQRVVELVR